MKITMTIATAIGLAALAACNSSPKENKADNIEANAENTADMIEANGSNAAENIEANAKTRRTRFVRKVKTRLTRCEIRPSRRNSAGNNQ